MGSHKRFISMIAAAGIFAAAVPAANAADWVTVSSWAYNDVSNFTNAGLLPESMEAVEDYTQSITRLQFAELICSVLLTENVISDTGSNVYEDIRDNKAVNLLYRNNIMNGEITGRENEYSEIRSFFPDRLITREEMAVVLRRTFEKANPSLLEKAQTDKPEPVDLDDISQFAKDDVCKMLSAGILTGDEDYRFFSKNDLTIEQAITAIYRLYKRIATTHESDGDNIIADSETELQRYENGLTETKLENSLYLKDKESVLMKFDTDIYSNIYSVTVSGTVYAAAQNINGKTDIYDVSTQKILFTVPYPILKTAVDYIITQSSVKGPMTFGLYSYDGEEILKPEYSIAEIELIKSNLMQPVRDSYRAPDGWIYYIDSADEHLYKTDSNGENRQMLSEEMCESLNYVDGWIFFSVKGPMYSHMNVMRADGSQEQILTDKPAYIIWDSKYDSLFYNPFRIGSRVFYVQEDGKTGVLPGKYGTIWSADMSSGTAHTEQICEIKVPFSHSNIDINSFIQVYDDKLYFDDYEKWLSNDIQTFENGSLPSAWTDFYCYDGSKAERINGDIHGYSYAIDEGKLYIAANEGEQVYYEAELDGSSPVRKEAEYGDWSEVNAFYDDLFSGKFDGKDFEHCILTASDDKYKIFYISRYNKVNKGYRLDATGKLIVRDIEGNTRTICEEGQWNRDNYIKRYDDVIYYTVKTEIRGRMTNELYSYDLDTSESRLCVPDAYKLSDIMHDRLFYYEDRMGNLWRFDTESCTASEVFPNAGLKRYGEMNYVFEKVTFRNGRKTEALYKIDVDGNILLIADGGIKHWQYVENGAETAKSGG